MKKILIPIDFSEASYNALDVAANIARKTGAKILLFHVYKATSEDLLYTEEGEDIKSGIKEDFNARDLEQVENELINITHSQKLNGIEANYEIDTESSDKAIPEDISRNLADLVVMGTEKVLDFDKCFIIGNRTQKVINTAKCPVLTVIKPIPGFKLDHIVYATDMSKDKFKIAKNINWLIKSYNAKVTFLHVNTKKHFTTSEELEEEFNARKKEFGIDFGELKTYDSEKIFKGIIHFSEEVNADMIVMPTQNMSGIRNFLFGSHTDNVLTHTEIPIMTFHLVHKIFKL